MKWIKERVLNTFILFFFFHQCTENSFKKLVSLLTQQDLLYKQLTQSRLLVLYTQEISTFVMQLSQAQNEKKKKKTLELTLSAGQQIEERLQELWILFPVV